MSKSETEKGASTTYFRCSVFGPLSSFVIPHRFPFGDRKGGVGGAFVLLVLNADRNNQ